MQTWYSFQAVPGQVATEAEWRLLTGDRFGALQALCLQPSRFQVQTVWCPHGCGCEHMIVRRHDGQGATAVCRCHPPCCPDIPLDMAKITALEVCNTRLGHALCRAFEFNERYAELSAPNTFQFGSWSADAVPAILTLQVQAPAFRRVVSEVVAQQCEPFMLFAPTSDYLDAPAKSLLEHHRCAFFDLQRHVVLTERGTLQPVRPPGELFARFTPQPLELDADVSERAFALVLKLDTEQPLIPTLLTVFRKYCIEELSCNRIARDCKVTKTTIVRRLALIRERVGCHPRELRRFSTHLEKLHSQSRTEE
ncbi:MAG TPA: hypothetical protein VKY92_06445 [Verrucomicrobiae bacterium]|nr:hypothetical protein [Verrucomicrobiae bacterium]